MAVTPEAEAADAPYLVGPVGPTSRVVRRDRVVYTELDGVAVLYDARHQTLHQLAPGAAVVWGELDGRPVADVGRATPPDGPGQGDDAPEVSEGAWSAVTELVRRFRAIGVAEDQRVGVAAPPTLDVAPYTGPLQLRAPDDGGEEQVPGAERRVAVLALEVVSGRVVADDDQQAWLIGVAWPSSDGSVAGAAPTAVLAGGLTRLGAALDTPSVEDPGVLDALAALVEEIAIARVVGMPHHEEGVGRGPGTGAPR